ncbi:MAG: hypothetical protein AAF805_07770, partial [Planctomycetota bacterium]
SSFSRAYQAITELADAAPAAEATAGAEGWPAKPATAEPVIAEPVTVETTAAPEPELLVVERDAPAPDAVRRDYDQLFASLREG